MPANDVRDDPEAMAHRSADRLAFALEEAGFDVGRAFLRLGGKVNLGGTPMVELGQITVTVADRLAEILSRAARHGLPDEVTS